MREDISFPHLIGVYLEELLHRGLAPATCWWRGYTLRLLARSLAGRRVRRATQVQAHHLVDWFGEIARARRPARAGRPSGPRYVPMTRLNMVRMVRAFFRWLCARGVLLMDPARDLAPVRGLVQPIVGRAIPTEQQMRELFDRLPGGSGIAARDRTIFELMYSSALRANEVRMLDVYDVDLDAGTVRVRAGKGGKDRVLPIGLAAQAKLVWWLETVRPRLVAGPQERALFVTEYGLRLGKGLLAKRLRFLRRTLGLPLVRLHDLRHACAVHLLRGGADVRHIQELLGHARAETTAIYTQLAPTDLKDAHRRCHPRERHRGPGR